MCVCDKKQPFSQSSSAISDVTSPVKLVGSKPPLVSRIARTGLGTVSPHVRESGKILLVESIIQPKESGIPLTKGIQNSSSTDKYWNLVPGIRSPRRGVQNPRLSWVLFLLGAISEIASQNARNGIFL